MKRRKLYFLLPIWLLFLPNAPYLLTDLIHLRLSPMEWVGFDAIMLVVFAITGITFYTSTVKQVSTILFKHFKNKVVVIFIAILPFLVSFGMYLGRVLRWNSWDILHNPLSLFMDVFEIITSPIENFEAWIFTIIIGIFLRLANWCFGKFVFDNAGD